MKKVQTPLVSLLFAAIFVALLPVGARAHGTASSDRPVLRKAPPAISFYKLKMSFDILDSYDGPFDDTVECYAVVHVNSNKIAEATDGVAAAGMSRNTFVPLKKDQTLNLSEITVPVSEDDPNVKLEVTLYDRDNGSSDDVLGHWTINADTKNGSEIVLKGSKAKLRYTLAAKNAGQTAKSTVRLSFMILDSSDGFADNTVECWANVSVDGQRIGGLERSKAKEKTKGEILDLDPIVLLSDDAKLTIALFDKDTGSADDSLGSWTTTLQAIKASKTKTITLQSKQARLTIKVE